MSGHKHDPRPYAQQGAKLKRMRKKKGWSQKTVNGMLGASTSDFELGRRFPDEALQKKIFQIFGKNPWESVKQVSKKPDVEATPKFQTTYVYQSVPVSVGQKVRRQPTVVLEENGDRWRDGTVVYVHPSGKWHTVEFECRNGRWRESFWPDTVRVSYTK